MTENNTNQLSVGDRLVDKDADPEDFSAMRVINPNVGEAKNVDAGGTPVSEYPGNEDYPETDQVVNVAFEESLDSLVNNWEDHINRLDEHLEEFADQWHVKVKRYPYPRSRLKKIPDTKK